ncbi:MAG: hypothetical protein J6Y29_06640 [Clostridiales bacterium]|nr:hypothetical protein [Clostridiales bacterium]
MVDFTKIRDKISKKSFIKRILIVLVVGILLMIVGDFSTDNNVKEDPKEVEILASLQSHSIEKEMEELLGKIEGAGKVRVMITYKTSKEVIREFEKKEIINDTKENDGGGGSKLIQQREISDTITFEENGGGRKAVIRKEIEPEIKGVVVVAEGAHDDDVRRNLQMAAKVLTDIPVHKISVFVMDK